MSLDKILPRIEAIGLRSLMAMVGMERLAKKREKLRSLEDSLSLNSQKNIVAISRDGTRE